LMGLKEKRSRPKKKKGRKRCRQINARVTEMAERSSELGKYRQKSSGLWKSQKGEKKTAGL